MANLYERIQIDVNIKLARRSLFTMMGIRDMSAGIRNQSICIEGTCSGLTDALYQLLRAMLRDEQNSHIPDFNSPGNISKFLEPFMTSICNRTANVMDALGFLTWAMDNVPGVSNLYNQIIGYGDQILPDGIWNKISDPFNKYVEKLEKIPPTIVSIFEGSVLAGAWDGLENAVRDAFGDLCIDSLGRNLAKYQFDLGTSSFKEAYRKYRCADWVLQNVYNVDLNTILLRSYGDVTIGDEYDNLMRVMFLRVDQETVIFDFASFFITMDTVGQSQVKGMTRQYSIFSTSLANSITSATHQKKLGSYLSFHA